jgi:hypothetical protein
MGGFLATFGEFFSFDYARGSGRYIAARIFGFYRWYHGVLGVLLDERLSVDTADGVDGC